MRLSYGLGLAFCLGGIARIELNYCLPVRAQRGDKPAPGLQLGVGVNFL
jgi:outer membrane protein insertion porin family